MTKVLAVLLLFGALFAASACSKPQPPTITPRSIRVSSVGPAGLTLAIELDVHNPNSFALSARSVEGALEIGTGIEVGNARAAPEAPIPARESAIVQSELRVGISNLLALAPYALQAQPVPYRFRGQALIGGESLNVGVPFELRGELTPAQLLELGSRGLGVTPRP
jgi:LEA14-like dessication related protein